MSFSLLKIKQLKNIVFLKWVHVLVSVLGSSQAGVGGIDGEQVEWVGFI